MNLSRRCTAAATLLLAGLLLGAAGPVQDGRAPSDDEAIAPRQGARRSRTPDDDRIARLYGGLVFTRVTVQLDATPVREAIAAIRAQIDFPLVARYDDDRLGLGLDPETPITLSTENAPLLGILEEILAQCGASGDACTWQIRKGFVEVGTKARLSVPAARDTRTYYVADVIMDIPEDVFGHRQRREVVALEAIAGIVETIEPDAWDWGQIDYDEPLEDEPAEPADLTLRRGRGADAGGGDDADPDSADRTAPTPRPRPDRGYVQPRKIAIIRYWRDVLIVNAPDYIHRQIDGYPDPIQPAREQEATIAEQPPAAPDR